jgi:hypothetical protein
MANEHWYMLKVRPGFAAVVAQRLRKLNFEVFVPENKSPQSRESSEAAESVYCQFELQDRGSVISVPGVLDILGTPEPVSIVPTWSSIQLASRQRS